MFDWLFESRVEVYVLLFLVAGVLVFFWHKSRDRRFLYAAACLVVLAVLYFLVGTLRETASEQIVRRVNDIPEGVNKGDLDRVFAHLSDSFKADRFDKKGMREYAERARKEYRLRDMQVSDVRVEEFDQKSDKAKVTFYVKADLTPAFNINKMFCRATFVKDPDGAWRMQTFTLHFPYGDMETPLPLPRL